SSQSSFRIVGVGVRYRSDVKAARTSVESSDSSQAVKCPPFSALVEWQHAAYPSSTQLRLHALRAIGDELPAGPARRCDAPPQAGQVLLRDLEVERLDLSACLGGAHPTSLSRQDPVGTLRIARRPGQARNWNYSHPPLRSKMSSTDARTRRPTQHPQC